MSNSYIPGSLLRDDTEVVPFNEGKIRVHLASRCEGHPCCIHNPSDHIMKDWRQHWRGDRGLMERLCPHGIGHPDPDDLDFKRRVRGDVVAGWEGVHGCDGCCTGRFPIGSEEPTA